MSEEFTHHKSHKVCDANEAEIARELESTHCPHQQEWEHYNVLKVMEAHRSECRPEELRSKKGGQVVASHSSDGMGDEALELELGGVLTITI